MCNTNYAKLPCRICARNTHDKDKAAQFDVCELEFILNATILII